MKLEYSFNNLRSAKAQFALLVTPQWMQVLLKAIAFASIIGMLLLLLAGDVRGWLLLIVFWPAIMILAWWEYELQELPALKHPDSLDDIRDCHVDPWRSFLYSPFRYRAKLFDANHLRPPRRHEYCMARSGASA
jgi:hypothetical protein